MPPRKKTPKEDKLIMPDMNKVDEEMKEDKMAEEDVVVTVDPTKVMLKDEMLDEPEDEPKDEMPDEPEDDEEPVGECTCEGYEGQNWDCTEHEALFECPKCHCIKTEFNEWTGDMPPLKHYRCGMCGFSYNRNMEDGSYVFQL